MGIKQKILVGTLVASTVTVLVGSIIVAPPVIIIGGIGIGLSLRKRLLFEKKKKKKNPIEQNHVMEPGQLDYEPIQ